MSGTSRKPTIYDIAKLCGASPSTVSAVLSGKSGARRIAEATREQIERIAAEAGYSTNMQARGLRRASSGLAGMIIPLHDNRFFSSLSQSFDTLARERGLVPVIASTLRDAREERRVVESLISYAIDTLIICGVSDPDRLGALCRAASLPHVFVDLPGRSAPSVVTDNFLGAERLTRDILARMPTVGDPAGARPFFVGGSTDDYATARRVEAFRSVCAASGRAVAAEQIVECGYAPSGTTRALETLCRRLGGLPAALFINSLTAFEGAIGHFATLPPEAFAATAIGSFDYDPFAAYLQVPVCMVRQDTHRMIEAAYDLLDSRTTEPVLIEVEPAIVPPRTLYRGPFSELG